MRSRQRRVSITRRQGRHERPHQHGRCSSRSARSCPCGRGTWPRSGCWPTRRDQLAGHREIDLMEHVGFDPDVVHGTIHTEQPYHVINTARGDQMTNCRTRCTASTAISSLDSRTGSRSARTTSPTSFDRVKRMRSRRVAVRPASIPDLNIAVGGTWGGLKGVDDAIFPARMEVDYESRLSKRAARRERRGHGGRRQCAPRMWPQRKARPLSSRTPRRASTRCSHA